MVSASRSWLRRSAGSPPRVTSPSAALAALRASEWLQPLAALTGTMLLCDAWFDVVTSAGGDELGRAVLEALFAELPIAALCGWIVVDTKRFHDAVLRMR